MSKEAASALGQGIAWMGFWIGLGLYNFQGCHTDIQTVHEWNSALERKPDEKQK